MALGDFVRRGNRDGSIDLICSRCFRTIAYGDSDAGFEHAQSTHKCDPADNLVARYGRSAGREHKSQKEQSD
jgi:hypothetical protein